MQAAPEILDIFTALKLVANIIPVSPAEYICTFAPSSGFWHQFLLSALLAQSQLVFSYQTFLQPSPTYRTFTTSTPSFKPLTSSASFQVHPQAHLALSQ